MLWHSRLLITELLRTIAATVLLILCFHIAPLHAASFDCTKAAIQTEIAICGDKSLSILDGFMGAWWKGQNKTSEVINTQKQWLITRDKCLGNTLCIKGTYLERLEETAMVESRVGKYSSITNEIQSSMLEMYDTTLKQIVWAKVDYYLCGAYNECSSIYVVKNDELKHLPARIPKFDESKETCGIEIEVKPEVEMLSTEMHDKLGRLYARFGEISLFGKWVGHGDKSSVVTYVLRKGELIPVTAEVDNCYDDQIEYKTIVFRDLPKR